MFYKICILSLMIVINFIYAIDDYKDLPEEKFVNWQPAEISFPDNTWDTVDVTSLGINPGNNIGDSLAKKFLEVLNLKGSAKRVFYFPEGTYIFEAPILIGPDGEKSSWNATGVDVNNFVIMGAGPQKTRFLFDCDVNYFKGLIWIEKPGGYSARNNPREINVTPQRGDSTVALQYTWDIEPGDFISVKSDNDPELMFPVADTAQAWYKKYLTGSYETDFAESYGQIVRVTEVLAQNVVKVTPLIALDFKESLTPRASVYLDDDRNENIGIQDIYIEHIIDDAAYTPGGVNDIFDIVIRFAKDCYVKNVESNNTARGHVIVEYSNNISITDSKFSYARNYGVGGAGYGVCIQNRSSIVSIENNEFVHLRHAVVLKEGANHCVVGYNYSHDWAILDPAVGIDAEADLSIHGMYSHNNLFEGNLCHNIYYADYWGPTGPKTTSFRNRVYGENALEGIYVDDFSHESNVIANHIPGLATLGTDSTCDSLLLEGNILGSNPVWNVLSLSSQLPRSLYRDNEPSYWLTELPWPAFGPDVVGSATNDIPASCDGGVSKVVNTSSAIHNINFQQLGNRIRISGNKKGPVNIKIYSLNGKCIKRVDLNKNKATINFSLNGFASGIYVLKLKMGNHFLNETIKIN